MVRVVLLQLLRPRRRRRLLHAASACARTRARSTSACRCGCPAAASTTSGTRREQTRDGRRRPRGRSGALRDDRADEAVAAHGRGGTSATGDARDGRHVRRAHAADRRRRPGRDGERLVERGHAAVRRQGPPRAGRAVDRLDRGRRAAPRARPERARQPRQVVGPAAVGRPEDVALVLDQHRRRHPLRRDRHRHRRRRPPPRLGVARRRSTQSSPSGRSRASSRTTASRTGRRTSRHRQGRARPRAAMPSSCGSSRARRASGPAPRS